MRTKKWSELSPRTRQFIIVTGVIEGALKVVALVDLARRPAEDVRGSKAGWAASIVLINSLGLVPVGYFVFGRKPAEPKAIEADAPTSAVEVSD
jgi:hypothetical protein